MRSFTKYSDFRFLELRHGYCLLHGHNGLLNDIHTFQHLFLVDDQGRGKTYDVTMGGLGQ